MKFFDFFKSPKFWQAVLHIVVVGAGSYAAYTTGTPLPLVISSGINAVLAAPQDAGQPKP